MQKGIHKICSSEIAQDECPMLRQSAAKLKLYLDTTFIKFLLHNVRRLRYLVFTLNQQFFLNPQSLSVSKPTHGDIDKRNQKCSLR